MISDIQHYQEGCLSAPENKNIGVPRFRLVPWKLFIRWKFISRKVRSD